MGSAALNGTPRVDWVDCAKGICIIMVVMMHSTLGVEDVVGRQGFMHLLVAFARPFRMPDFFLISGLFLARVIDRDWRTYLDRKVVHFAYFYVLWVTIQFVVKAPNLISTMGVAGTVLFYFESFIEPFGTLWFIYLLPLFFVVTKLTRHVPVIVIWVITGPVFLSSLQFAGAGQLFGPQSALALILILPPAVFGLAIQRYLVRGLTFGAIKR